VRLGFLIFWLVAIAGWIMNIIQVGYGLPSTIGEMTPMLIFKIVGIFVAPLGSILGWIGVF
jgi:hypothetical protein